ncbi:MAG: RNA polymerase-binding protein DksA, partial [Porphyrobacter sp. HL-46]
MASAASDEIDIL